MYDRLNFSHHLLFKQMSEPRISVLRKKVKFSVSKLKDNCGGKQPRIQHFNIRQCGRDILNFECSLTRKLISNGHWPGCWSGISMGVVVVVVVVATVGLMAADRYLRLSLLLISFMLSSTRVRIHTHRLVATMCISPKRASTLKRWMFNCNTHTHFLHC